jgi:gamma-glutamylcyclotransferase (GGCT)/AIG2-like uncharacterized protein YtfP
MSLLFVYGTLKSGERNNHLMEGRLVRKAKTYKGFRLVDCGNYPGLVRGDKAIEGEVWEVSEPTLARLDRFEGVYRGVYVREQIMLEDGTRVQVYLHTSSDLPEYPGTCWRAAHVDNGQSAAMAG